MSHIIDSEPSCYEEASSQPIWRDAMMEGYQSIMKNDVWDVIAQSVRVILDTGHTRDVEVLMRSTVSTCPRVGARCYPLP
jgi:hypothetical protein